MCPSSLVGRGFFEQALRGGGSCGSSGPGCVLTGIAKAQQQLCVQPFVYNWC